MGSVQISTFEWVRHLHFMEKDYTGRRRETDICFRRQVILLLIKLDAGSYCTIMER